MTLNDVLAERKTTHGDFTDHAYHAQQLKTAAQRSPNWKTMTSVQREAVDMILHKIARVLTGNPNHHDHWIDMAGYAQLVADRIEP